MHQKKYGEDHSQNFVHGEAGQAGSHGQKEEDQEQSVKPQQERHALAANR